MQRLKLKSTNETTVWVSYAAACRTLRNSCLVILTFCIHCYAWRQFCARYTMDYCCSFAVLYRLGNSLVFEHLLDKLGQGIQERACSACDADIYST